MIQSCKGFKEFQAIVHQLFSAFLEGSDLNNFLIIFRHLDFGIFSVIWFSFVRITLIPYKCEEQEEVTCITISLPQSSGFCLPFRLHFSDPKCGDS